MWAVMRQKHHGRRVWPGKAVTSWQSESRESKDVTRDKICHAGPCPSDILAPTRAYLL